MGDSNWDVGERCESGKSFRQKNPPPEAGDSWDDASAQEQDENDERDRNPDKPEQNGHGFFSFRVAD
jgi:hypothetical protein